MELREQTFGEPPEPFPARPSVEPAVHRHDRACACGTAARRGARRRTHRPAEARGPRARIAAPGADDGRVDRPRARYALPGRRWWSLRLRRSCFSIGRAAMICSATPCWSGNHCCWPLPPTSFIPADRASSIPMNSTVYPNSPATSSITSASRRWLMETIIPRLIHLLMISA